MGQHFTIGVPEDKPFMRKAFFVVHLIDSALKVIFNQEKRINSRINSDNPSSLPILFGDIHLYFINAANIKEYLDKLSEYFSEDLAFDKIRKSHQDTFAKLSSLRNHQEHILDGRLDGMGKIEPLSEPSMLGNISNGEYNFGGEKIDLVKSFREFEQLQTELMDWNRDSKVYPLWYV